MVSKEEAEQPQGLGTRMWGAASGWMGGLFKKVYTFGNGWEVEEVKQISEGGFAYVSLGKAVKKGNPSNNPEQIVKDSGEEMY